MPALTEHGREVRKLSGVEAGLGHVGPEAVHQEEEAAGIQVWHGCKVNRVRRSTGLTRGLGPLGGSGCLRQKSAGAVESTAPALW